jgi:hypothetical protein
MWIGKMELGVRMIDDSRDLGTAMSQQRTTGTKTDKEQRTNASRRKDAAPGEADQRQHVKNDWPQRTKAITVCCSLMSIAGVLKQAQQTADLIGIPRLPVLGASALHGNGVPAQSLLAAPVPPSEIDGGQARHCARRALSPRYTALVA